MLEIKILGPGCANCSKLEELTRQAVAGLAVEASVTKVKDFAEIAKYNILSTPGLVINGKVVCSGRVPPLAEITTLLTTALAETG